MSSPRATRSQRPVRDIDTRRDAAPRSSIPALDNTVTAAPPARGVRTACDETPLGSHHDPPDTALPAMLRHEPQRSPLVRQSLRRTPYKIQHLVVRCIQLTVGRPTVAQRQRAGTDDEPAEARDLRRIR